MGNTYVASESKSSVAPDTHPHQPKQHLIEILRVGLNFLAEWMYLECCWYWIYYQDHVMVNLTRVLLVLYIQRAPPPKKKIMHTLIKIIYGYFQSLTEMLLRVCSVIFSQKMVLVTWMPAPLNRTLSNGYSKKIVAEWLTVEQCKIIFEVALETWKYMQNARTVAAWICNRISNTINNSTHSWQIWDRWHDAWCTQATSPASSAMVLEQFPLSPKNNVNVKQELADQVYNTF
jgi:hypothetical protein